ncbi:MAG TPA: hypothetical protein VFV17_02230 [Usitatibacteraceae bacterium]|nr:hypothetical protein [Usitatibacteraceae bacterium]
MDLQLVGAKRLAQGCIQPEICVKVAVVVLVKEILGKIPRSGNALGNIGVDHQHFRGVAVIRKQRNADDRADGNLRAIDLDRRIEQRCGLVGCKRGLRLDAQSREDHAQFFVRQPDQPVIPAQCRQQHGNDLVNHAIGRRAQQRGKPVSPLEPNDQNRNHAPGIARVADGTVNEIPQRLARKHQAALDGTVS